MFLGFGVVYVLQGSKNFTAILRGSKAARYEQVGEKYFWHCNEIQRENFSTKRASPVSSFMRWWTQSWFCQPGGNSRLGQVQGFGCLIVRSTKSICFGGIHMHRIGRLYISSPPPSLPLAPNLLFLRIADVPIASGGLVRAPRACHASSRSPGQPRSAGKKGTLDRV